MKKMLWIAVVAAFTQAASAQTFMSRTGRVSFFSSTPLENIEAINNESSAIINAATGDVAYQVPIKSFRFPNALMQEHFNENYMESDQFPKAVFKGKMDNPGAVSYDKDGTYKTNVTGQLTIHGVTKNVSVPGTVEVKAGVPTVNTKFNIKTADYGIKIPGLAAGKIAQQIEITIVTPLARK